MNDNRNDRKLIFLDIDGTLVTDDKEIPAENKKALDEARAAGHLVALASGRVIDSVKAQARKLGLDDEGCYVLGFNGAICVDMHTDEVVYCRPVPRQHVRPLFDMAEEMGLHTQTYESSTVITEHDDDEIHYYSTRLKTPYKIVENIEEYLKEDPCKCLFVDLKGRDKLEVLRQKILPYCKENGLDTFYSDPIYLDVVKAGVSKAAGIEYMCQKFGIAHENTIAAGDAENDISMIEAAALGCAVANAPDNVKAHADYVTENDNNHCAVAEIIRKFVL
ncbi:MAG: HAD family phosphatase [Eubacterium sp.]|nr:HAD family phosphatase [Candidatus Colimonas fimequi]